jgi:hypothetical protein
MARPMNGTAALVCLLALILSCSETLAQPVDWSIHAPPALSGVEARLSSLDVEPFARSLAVAGLALPDRVEIRLVPDDDPRARDIPPWVVAQARGVDAITIYPHRIGSYPYDSLESVVLHELVHVALNARSKERALPRWFHEGVAVSVEGGWGVSTQARLLWAAAREPGLDHVATLFASDAIPETTTAYLLSAALVEDLRRRHGMAVPGAIAARVGAGEPFEVAFVAETGESVDQAAARAWRVYRGFRWLPIVTSPTAIWSGILGLAAMAFLVRQRRRQQRHRRWEQEESESENESPAVFED